jgi:hypothetical protein
MRVTSRHNRGWNSCYRRSLECSDNVRSSFLELLTELILQGQQTVFSNEVSREGHPSPASNGLQLQPSLGSVMVIELGGRGSSEQFPSEAESNGGHVPLVVQSRMSSCASSDTRSGAAKSILSSVGGFFVPGSPYSRSRLLQLEYDFSKCQTWPGKDLCWSSLTTKTGGTGVPRDGHSRWHSGGREKGTSLNST